MDRIVNPKFFHDLAPVGLHSAHAHIEGLSDLPGGMALCNELEYLSLPVREELVSLFFGGAFAGGKI